ncbi:hypothetical protein BJV77DRAFT_960158 [Russula vinacea]|nr:hypothetical protein BJV77DRAFT_960158 [Russula vinacea]
MCTYPNQYYPYPYYTPPQSNYFDSSPVPTLSTNALQDIVEGQQRTTNGLVSLLSQERVSNEQGTRDNKQQLSNLLTLSQNFLSFIPEVEQKFSALDSSIQASANKAEVEDRLNDMDQVIANLKRIAEGFASSTGLRLVPGLAPNQWGWVPASASTTPPQQDPFCATYTQAPHIYPTVIPNSTRSSNPARSVHWPSNLNAPPSSCAAPWLDPYSTNPYGTSNAPSAFSRISLGGVRGFSAMSPSAPSTMPPPPMTPTMSGSSSPPTPMAGRFGPCSPVPTPQLPSVHCSFPPPVPTQIMEPPHLQRRASSPPPASTPSQTESVVGSLRHTRLSPITESRTPSPGFPPLPAFGRTPLGKPSPSTSPTETFSTPSGPIAPPPNVPQANDPMRQALFDMMYPSVPSLLPSSNTPSILSSPPSVVEVPSSRSVETVRWSSLFPSAPVIIHPPPLTRVSSVDETVSSMSSPARSIICYTDSPKFSSPSEPMTPLSRASGEVIEAMPTKLTTDIVDKPKESNDPVVIDIPGTSAVAQAQAVASSSNTSIGSAVPPNQLAVQLLSFFFETVQRIFKVPASVDLSYQGFEVSFSTDGVPWNNASLISALVDDEDGEQGRTFEMMPAPSNAALHRYIKDLARVRMDLAAMQAGENEDKEQTVVQLELRVKAEQEATQNWIKRVCKAAGALSIVDPAFSPRK